MQDRVRDARADPLVPGAPTEPDAFLEWTSRQPGRFELSSRGRVIEMQAGVGRSHSIITGNIMKQLLVGLPDDRFHVSHADFGVRAGRAVRYPDILVERLPLPLEGLASEHPILLAEVLSPSTEDEDLIEKLAEYTSLPSLKTYIVCSKDELQVRVWTRRRGAFPADPRVLTGRKGSITLGGLGVRLSMAAIYRGIPDGGD